MSTSELPLILEAEQLLPLLDNKELLIIDLSDADTYRAYHLPGAIHLDYDDLCCELPRAPGELNPDAPLSQLFNQLGLTHKHHVVAYDNVDNSRACRLLWTLDLIGHNQYSLLDGGLAAWLDERHPVTDEVNDNKPSDSRYTFLEDAPTTDLFYLLTHLNDSKLQLVDARSEAEYKGEELRGTRGGHIPGAINLDYREFLSPEHSQRLKAAKEIHALAKAAGLKPKQETICYCHSHRRSALVYIALKSIGFSQLKAYPGSFSEWGNNLDTPIE